MAQNDVVIISAVILLPCFLHCDIALKEAMTTSNSICQCICPGDELMYECTVEGDDGATFWTGTTFDCPQTENQIEFLHSRGFVNTTRGCNSGAIVGCGVRVEGSNYTSQLIIIVDPSMDGKTVSCFDSSKMLIDNSTIMLTSVPFPPPTNVSAEIEVVNSHSWLTFKWSTVTFDCASIAYIITSDCGYCPNTTTNTEVVCTDIVIGAKCTFTIQTEVCDTLTGNITTIHLKLKVPDAPVVSIIPTYSHETSLLVALTVFLEDDIMETIDELNNSIINYSLVLSSSGESCFSANTSASSFAKGVYRYLLDISSCLHNSNVNMSLHFSATNILGAGSPCVKTVGQRNKFINVSYDQYFTTVKCTFLTWPQVMSGDTTDYNRAESNYYNCSIAYGINKSQVATGFAVDSNIVLLHLADKQEEHRNFTVTASCDNYTIYYVDGTFIRNGSRFSPDTATVTVTIVITLSLVITLAVVSVVSLGIVCFSMKRKLRNDNKVQAKTTQLDSVSDLFSRTSTSHEQVESQLNNSIGVYSLLQSTEDTYKRVIYTDVGPVSGGTHRINFLSDDKVEYTELKHQPKHFVPRFPDLESKTHCQDPDVSINLVSLLIQLQNEVKEYWYEFGLTLGVTKEIMDKYIGYSSDQCLKEVLDHWLRSRHHGHNKPTWREIAQALNEIGLRELSNKIAQVYITGRLLFEADMNANLDSLLHQEKQHLSSESGSDVHTP